jgi:phospholipid/cholesterol/gamma-HCH transport system substrate-binding protein
VLGLRFLYVYPGNGRGHVLKDGDTIPLTHTDDAADLGQFLNQLGPILKAIDPDKANAFLDSMNSALSGNEIAVRSLLDNGAVLASKLSGMDRQIQTLISSSDTVVSTYAGQSQAIGGILDHLNHVGAQLDTMTGDLDTFITSFTDVQTRLHGLLTTSRGTIDMDLLDLQAVVDLLARNKNNLSQTLCTLPAGVTPYFQTTSWGEWFNVRVEKFKFADSNSKTIASAQEFDNERPPVALPRPFTCGQGSPFGKGAGAAARRTGGGSGGAAGFENVGGFLKTVVGGDSHG